MKDIRSAKDLKSKKVLLRCDLNVPVKDGKILDDFRLVRTLSTIDFLREKDAKIILIGHIGRDSKNSLAPTHEFFKKYFPVNFTQEVIGSKTSSAIDSMKDGEIVLLENLRRHEGETENDSIFAKQLASLGDIYVNNAFSVSHRKHASIIGVPKLLPSYAGILFQEEIEELSVALTPPAPALCILGGAKFNTKEPLVRKLLDVYDNVFVSGALAHDFFRTKGYNIGKSLSADTGVNLKELVENKKIMMPTDVVVQNEDGIFLKKPNEISDNDSIKDSGPETTEKLAELIKNFKFILWNGPLGEYEKGFIKPTETLALALAGSSAKTLIGGGDTIASIEHLELEDKFSFVSTGGGAMLKFLLDGTLVGIEALKD